MSSGGVVSYGGTDYQVSQLSSVSTRPVAGAWDILAMLGIAGFGLLAMASLATGGSAGDLALGFGGLIGCGVVLARSKQRWEVITKIGLDEKRLYLGATQEDAERFAADLRQQMSGKPT